MVIVYRTSPFSNEINRMDIDMTPEEYEAACIARARGAKIQDAYPMLNPAEREFIMTGITDEEWSML